MLTERAEEQARTGFAATRTAQLNALAGWPDSFLGSDAEQQWKHAFYREKNAEIFSLADALAALEHIGDEGEVVDHPHLFEPVVDSLRRYLRRTA
jgi:hypothetical protein